MDRKSALKKGSFFFSLCIYFPSAVFILSIATQKNPKIQKTKLGIGFLSTLADSDLRKKLEKIEFHDISMRSNQATEPFPKSCQKKHPNFQMKKMFKNVQKKIRKTLNYVGIPILEFEGKFYETHQ